MELSAVTKIDDLLKEFPFLMDFFVERSPKFRLLQSPAMRQTVGRVATLSQIAIIGGIDIGQLLDELADEISSKTGKKDIVVHRAGATSEEIKDALARQEILKDIISDLHAGVDMAILKKRFVDLIKDIDASEIARMEQKLIDEGMSESEVKRLCDIHVKVFEESLDSKEELKMPAGHPVHTYMLENRALEEVIRQMRALLDRLGTPPDEQMVRFLQYELQRLIDSLSEVDIHFLRKENQLFPVLEAHGISGPSSVMWALHDDIRKSLRKAHKLIAETKAAEGIAKLRETLQTLAEMIYKEEKILFPMAIELLTEADWIKVREAEEEIGYAWGTIAAPWLAGSTYEKKDKGDATGLNLDTGVLTLEQVNLMLTHLPVDLSFVNENDEVVYYSQTKERIFPRSPGVIGRKVQNCHPPKSVDTVQKILDEFRAGKKDVADFWIQLQGKFFHIRYFALRDVSGNYRGTLEVSQDITDIRKLDGQKRLLDWQ